MSVIKISPPPKKKMFHWINALLDRILHVASQTYFEVLLHTKECSAEIEGHQIQVKGQKPQWPFF